MTCSRMRQSLFSRILSALMIVTFVITIVISPRVSFAQEGVNGLPMPGVMVNLSPAYVPLMVTGLKVHPENPLLMDFIVNTGNSGLGAADVKEQSSRLIKYFLACLTIPEGNQWVNLSPYEKERIVPEDLGQTVLGQDMLAQDYLLKQLTASLIYPEKDLGKNFWDKVYSEARQEYGTTQIPVNTFNKVWILPDTAKVYEHNNTVMVVKSHLKVMLDEDYLALVKHESAPSVNDLGNKIIRQIILPAIEEEVNQGQNFANMRQIYNSMILAVWFKKSLKAALLNQVYTDKSKVNGVNTDDPALKERIYQQYIEAYKKGVFNYIKEEVDATTQETIPRKYFSGGLTAVTAVEEATRDEAMVALNGKVGNDYLVSGLTSRADAVVAPQKPVLSDAAMVSIERLSPQQIMARFHLAYSDALYLSVLIAKYLSDRIKPVLGTNAIASALLNAEARQSSFGMADGKDLFDDPANSEVARKVHLRVLELKGGLGTSFKREATLLRLTGRKTLADKGTDSFFENVRVDGFDVSGQPKVFNENISVAELKLLYYIHLAQEKQFSEVEVQELVNAESLDAVSKFWDTVYLGDRVDDRIPADKKRTYRQFFNEPDNGLRFDSNFIIQGVMPVIDAQSGEYLNNEALRSPGGHGAFVALTMDENARNQRDLEVPRITVFTNGDGVNNMLPPAVAGWMVRNNAPIVMVTTTKQLLDLKGGLITLLSNTPLPPDVRAKLNRFETLSMEDIASLQGTLYPYLLEIAQAKAEGQQEMFQGMGITLGEKSAQFFNTNLHAQYHNVLDPFLAELRGIIGDEKFYEIIGPDLIVNPKDKKVDGKAVSVIQLEGASGSALLAMNRFVLNPTGTPDEILKINTLKAKYKISRLVYFVNFDAKLRSVVFTPEKYTWDHYLYAFTDLFKLDPVQGRLIFTPNEGRSTLPGLELDKPYEDLEYDINAFGRHLSIRGLDYLAIKGEVRVPNAILRGGVFIKNRSGKVVDLTDVSYGLPVENGRLVLDNVYVNIDKDGVVSTKPVTDILQAIGDFEKVDAAMQTAIDDGTADQINDTRDQAMAVSVMPVATAHIADKASLVEPGGIDLNSSQLRLQSEGEKVNIAFDPAMIAQFRRGDFSGVRIQILDVVPVNLMSLLGL